MIWNVKLSSVAKKQIKKIDRKWQSLILDYLEDEIASLENPRSQGKCLVGTLKGCWRYRVGDYRIIAEIRDSELVILVVEIDHRKNIYR